MNGPHTKYVLVGGGGAGSAAATEIRRHDPAGSILLIGQEHSRPYIRTTLSKEYLRREKTRMEIAIEPVGWYSQRDIELRTGRRVSRLDTSRRSIALDNGEEISFDKLLLATGASPRLLTIPGADLPNVFYLRTIDDCDRLHHAIDKAKAEGRTYEGGRGKAVIIGSGVLAVEVAASLNQMGVHSELLTGGRQPWGKFAGENTAKFLTRYLQNHGVVVHVDASADRLEGDGRVQRVVSSIGSIDCDFVVVAIGMSVNRELLRGTPISAEKAILVDEHCRTNVADIYAAGDCAAIFDPLFGKHRILDHWDNAGITGAIAGANMAGADARYDIVNSFFSDVFNLTLQGWGEARLVDHRLMRGIANIESPDFAEIGVAADGRVAQVLTFGRKDEQELLRDLVQRRVNISGFEELIKDPARPLRNLGV
jgi:3-phenylpropionate/trans-cinnamate dioxygenase ferredoxin reductase subunit